MSELINNTTLLYLWSDAANLSRSLKHTPQMKRDNVNGFFPKSYRDEESRLMWFDMYS